ncbi:LpxL/LpxP family acyltransferase [Neisseria chenwenguii]|uniref:Glycosyl transferase family 2 n=1 Tax=Neisseria chenwenguii TaxID=1853278 RepID=A0A220RZJ2_9NEIS|nr:glycosyl transferase family 2 [Neisseria chenwenguii]ASK26395.1 glycosyl transferase family 2 [Neisseria chenwenguii]ROV55816.1 glycosyl transferase family 2 [Neisseria chenwenguii]
MKTESHWAAQQERGSRFFLRLTTLMVRCLPASLMNPCIWFVTAYFYLTAPAPRRNIRLYQTRLQAAFPDAVLPRRAAVFRQFAAFGRAVCDRFAVWQHKIRYENLLIDDAGGVSVLLDNPQGRGRIFACSHLGNTEICRALVSHHRRFTLNVLVHSRHAAAFNEALENAGADKIRLIQVTDLDAALMMELNRRIDAGEWLAVAADRVPVRGEKTVAVDFLGHRAQMPQGAWLLAALLKTPVYTLFCIRENGRYRLSTRLFLENTDWKYGERAARVAEAAQRFADEMAAECAKNPLQWFNFYRFWEE